MRWLTTALFVCLASVGCTDERRQAGRRLADSVDTARRLYNHAASLRADPQYILEVESARLVPVSAHPDAPARPGAVAQKVENALDRLDKARDLLETALAANAAAPSGIKADANLLLGQIQLEKGRFHLTGAERMRAAADRARRKVQGLLRTVRGKLSLAAFYGALENMPRDKIVALQKQAQTDAQALTDKTKAAQAKIATLQKEIGGLSQASKDLFAKASQLRDRSEIVGGAEGLKLWKQATDLDAKINANGSKIAANKQQIEDLQADLTLLAAQQTSAQAKLGALNDHLKGMASDSQQAGEAEKTARSGAVKAQAAAEAGGAEVAKHCQAAATQEERAFAGLKDAEKRFGLAERDIRKVVTAAGAAQAKTTEPDEILAGMANDQHLASIMGLRAMARLSMGELRRYQLGTSQANDALAKDVAATAKLLGQGPPPVVKALSGYVADPTATTKDAEEDYQVAQKDLEDVLRSHLKRDEVGRNIQWIYQGKLAQAYLGQYLLTKDPAVLNKAGEWVGKALADKEGSPHLSAVVELRRLIVSVAPGQ